MKLFQFLVAALLLVFVGSVYAAKPLPVVEQNVDTQGDIKVAIQNTDAIPVHEQGLVDVNVTGEAQVREADTDANGYIAVHEQGIANVNVTNTVEVGGTITVDSMPPVLNGDHPALTSFAQQRNFSVEAGGNFTSIIFNDESDKVCQPGDKIVITTITGSIYAWEGEENYPEQVLITAPVVYHLTDPPYRVTSGNVDGRSAFWTDHPNIIFDANPEIVLYIYSGLNYAGHSWRGEWAIYGYCFTP